MAKGVVRATNAKSGISEANFLVSNSVLGRQDFAMTNDNLRLDIEFIAFWKKILSNPTGVICRHRKGQSLFNNIKGFDWLSPFWIENTFQIWLPSYIHIRLMWPYRVQIRRAEIRKGNKHGGRTETDRSWVITTEERKRTPISWRLTKKDETN